MRSIWRRISSFIPYLIAVGATSALLLWPTGKQSADQVAKKKSGAVPAVTTVRVSRGNLVETYDSPGVAAALSEVKVSAEVGGVLKDVSARVGAMVRQGEVLATQDDELMRSDLEQAEAAVVRSADQLRRVQELAARKLADQNRLQTAVAQNRIDMAALAKARTLLQLSQHRSPIDGVVTAQVLFRGDAVQAGSHIATVADVSRILVFAKVPETVAMRLKSGATVVLRGDSLGETSLAGRILRVHPQADPVSHQVTVELDAGPAFARLKPGFLIMTRFTTAARKNVLTLERKAVPDRIAQGPAEVFVVRDSVAISRSIQLGLAVDDRVEVLGGLAEGDHVVVRGSESLKSGAAVRVANVTPGSGK